MNIALSEVLIQLIWLSIGFILSANDYTWIPGQIILGTGFWRAFAIVHTCGHQSFVRKTWLNDFLGLFFSVFCVIPYYPWKYIHQDHHVWTGWIDLDPTTKGLLKKPSKLQLKILDWCWRCWIPLISIHYIFTIFFNIRHSSFIHKNRKRWKIALSIFVVISFHIACLLILESEWIRYFGLSLFLYLNLGDLSLLTQHVHLPLDHSGGMKVSPKTALEQEKYSHTMHLPYFVERWVILGFNRHAFHHIYPRLPYYEMKEDASFEGTHQHYWKEWIMHAKSMKASQLIYDLNIQRLSRHSR